MYIFKDFCWEVPSKQYQNKFRWTNKGKPKNKNSFVLKKIRTGNISKKFEKLPSMG